MGGIGMRELIIILLVVLVIFGTKKLRSIGSDLGGAVSGFKKAMKDGESRGPGSGQAAQVVGTDAEFPESKTTSNLVVRPSGLTAGASARPRGVTPRCSISASRS